MENIHLMRLNMGMAIMIKNHHRKRNKKAVYPGKRRARSCDLDPRAAIRAKRQAKNDKWFECIEQLNFSKIEL